MVQRSDSRKTFYIRWFQYTIKMMNLRKQGKIPPRSSAAAVVNVQVVQEEQKDEEVIKQGENEA